MVMMRDETLTGKGKGSGQATATDTDTTKAAADCSTQQVSERVEFSTSLSPQSFGWRKKHTDIVRITL